MKLTEPVTNPIRWRFLIYRRAAIAAYAVAGWLYRQQVRHDGRTPATPDLARVTIPADHDHLSLCLTDHEADPDAPCTDHPACWPDLCWDHADWEDDA